MSSSQSAACWINEASDSSWYVECRSCQAFRRVKTDRPEWKTRHSTEAQAEIWWRQHRKTELHTRFVEHDQRLRSAEPTPEEKTLAGIFGGNLRVPLAPRKGRLTKRLDGTTEWHAS